MSQKPVIYSALYCIIFLLAACPASAQAPWKTVKTTYLTLHYQDDSDLKAFDRKIKPVEQLEGFNVFSPKNHHDGPHADLAEKLDSLVEKVQLILDMRKPINVNVRIYPDKDALSEAYFKIYKKKKALRAWYIHEYNTIYLQVEDLFSGMLAHEVGHAVVDHFLAVKPPRATAEILARYVDAHLNKKAKIY